MRRQQARLVGHTFSQNLLALDAEVSQRAVAIKLRNQFRGGALVLNFVLGSPPIAEFAVRIIDVAQIIEAVADFVSETGSGRSIVRCGVTPYVEIRRLKNGGGKNSALGLNMMTAPGICGLIGHSIGSTGSSNLARLRERRKASARRMFPSASPRTTSSFV